MIINKIVTLIIAGMNPCATDKKLYQVYIDIVLLLPLKFMAKSIR